MQGTEDKEGKDKEGCVHQHKEYEHHSLQASEQSIE
jgi:hypothetical protein